MKTQAARTRLAAVGRAPTFGRLATFGLCLAVLVMLALDLGRGWAHRDATHTPHGDEAVLTLAALDAYDGETARGAYSRFGWSHPGPLLVHQLELGLRVAGRRSSALPWCVAVGNTACLVFVVLLVFRERSPWLRAVLPVAVALCLAALGVDALPSTALMLWNPIAPLAPLLLLVCLAFSQQSRPWVLPLVVLLHAYMVQAHVGYAVIASLLAVGASWRAVRGLSLLARPGAWAFVTTSVGIAAWWSLPRGGSNLLEILHFFLNRPDDLLPWSDALFLAARRTQAGVLYLAGEQESGQLALALLGAQLLILSAHLGERLILRRGVPWSVLALSLGAVLVAVLSSFAVDDGRNEHQTHWFVVVGTFAWVGAAWPMFERRLSRAGWVLALAITSAILFQYDDDSRERHEIWRAARSHEAWVVGGLADIIESAGDDRPVSIQIGRADHALWGLAATLAVAMDQRGRRVAIDPRFRFMFGERRTHCPPPCRRLWLSERESPHFREVGSIGGYSLVEPMAPAEAP